MQSSHGNILLSSPPFISSNNPLSFHSTFLLYYLPLFFPAPIICLIPPLPTFLTRFLPSSHLLFFCSPLFPIVWINLDLLSGDRCSNHFVCEWVTWWLRERGGERERDGELVLHFMSFPCCYQPLSTSLSLEFISIWAAIGLWGFREGWMVRREREKRTKWERERERSKQN